MQVFEKIIEKLENYNKANKECRKTALSKHNDNSFKYFQNLIFAIEQAIFFVEEVAEEYNNGWIPCSERLPDEKEREHTVYDAITLAEVDVERQMESDLVNVTVKDCDSDKVFTSDDCTVNGEWVNYNCYPFEIIAWQPLPEPYQQKGEQ